MVGCLLLGLLLFRMYGRKHEGPNNLAHVCEALHSLKPTSVPLKASAGTSRTMPKRAEGAPDTAEVGVVQSCSSLLLILRMLLAVVDSGFAS